MSKVSVIIPTHNRRHFVIRCIESVLRNSYKNKEIIVVDDHSSDGTYESLLNMYKGLIKVIRTEKELWKSAAVNRGFRYSNGEYILVIDDDVELDSRAITEMVKILDSNPDVGVVGPVCYFQSRKDVVYHVGVRESPITATGIYLMHGSTIKLKRDGIVPVDNISDVFMIRREIWEKIGGFDAVRFPWGREIDDLHAKIRKLGYIVCIALSSSAYHHILPVKLEKEKFRALRLYFMVRGKIIFTKLHMPKVTLFSSLLLLPMYLAFHIRNVVKESPENISNKLKSLLLGALDGIIYLVYDDHIIKRLNVRRMREMH